MKRISSFQFDNVTQYQVPLPAGWYRGILLSLEGTNESGQTFTRANFGDIRLYRDGKRIWEITAEKLWYFVEQNYLGAQQFSSTISSTVLMSLYIPFHFGQDNNVCRLGSEYTLEFSHADLTAVLATTTLTILAQTGLGQEKYFPIYQNFSIRALTNLTEPEKLQRTNLAYAVIDFSSNHTHFRLKKGDNYVYDMSDEESDFQNAIETPVSSYAATSSTVPVTLSLYKDKNLVEVAGKGDVALGVVSSDTNFTGFTVEFELNASRMARSNDTVKKIAQSKAGSDGELTNILA